MRQLNNIEPSTDTGILAIDELINGHLGSVTLNSHIQVQKRSTTTVTTTTTTTTTAATTRSPPAQSKSNPVIEIVGWTPSTGKTEFLYRATAQLLLHSPNSSYPNSPSEGAVIWIDIGNRFSISRLYAIQSDLLEVSEDYGDLRFPRSTLAKASLQHLHVFRPQSAESLLATIKNLSNYLTTPNSRPSFSRPLRGIVLSDISSFYWQQRQDEAERSTINGAYSSSLLVDHWRDLVKELKEIQDLFGCAIISSNTALLKPSPGEELTGYRSHLPAVWNNFVTTRVILEKKISQGEKFGHGISVEEALMKLQMQYGRSDTGNINRSL